MPAPVFAGTVIYTNSHHPPRNADVSVVVIYLDGPEQLQAQIPGALPSDPDELHFLIPSFIHFPSI